ncbi:MAG: hypothetical protein RLZZ318_568 [Bacteroidota bacterium]|jgi:sec-independent protein translocase protein TatC
MPLDQDPIEDKEMSFFDHLDAFRSHLVKSAYAIAILSIVALFYMDTIFHGVILAPLRPDFISYRFVCYLSHHFYGNDQFCVNDLNIELMNTEMAGQFMMSFKLAFVFGIIVAMPYIIWQLWQFLRPALTQKERSKIKGFSFYTTGLFLVGIAFGYFILCPISVNFLSNYSMSPLIKNRIVISNVVSFMTLVVVGSGLIFELPILMFFLAKLGLISSAFLKKYRKHAFVVILIVAAIATPPDVVSQITLTIPMYSLFELGIVIIKRVEKQKAEHV